MGWPAVPWARCAHVRAGPAAASAGEAPLAVGVSEVDVGEECVRAPQGKEKRPFSQARRTLPLFVCGDLTRQRLLIGLAQVDCTEGNTLATFH